MEQKYLVFMFEIRKMCKFWVPDEIQRGNTWPVPGKRPAGCQAEHWVTGDKNIFKFYGKKITKIVNASRLDLEAFRFKISPKLRYIQSSCHFVEIFDSIEIFSHSSGWNIFFRNPVSGPGGLSGSDKLVRAGDRLTFFGCEIYKSEIIPPKFL